VAPSRWQCAQCDPRRGVFLACSRRCLDLHRRGRHGSAAPGPAAERALTDVRQANRDHGRHWELYQGHRQRLTRLCQAVQRADGLCVLGAGNGDDLDLPALVRAFGEVHLVDLDGEALERAHARTPAPARSRVTLHGGVDLGGLLGSVERWADDFPGRAEWGALEARAREEITRRIGRTFDVVLSAAVVSQLCVPFYRMLVARPPEWTALMRALAGVHLGAVADLTRPGGTGVVVGDLAYAAGAPAPSWDALPPEVEERLRDGVLLLRRPDFLREVLEAPALARLVESPRLTEPWLWSQESGDQLAYALMFRRC
jgi:hypothetical protein